MKNRFYILRDTQLIIVAISLLVYFMGLTCSTIVILFVNEDLHYLFVFSISLITLFISIILLVISLVIPSIIDTKVDFCPHIGPIITLGVFMMLITAFLILYVAHS
jgi:hypothetical protein